MNMLKRVLKLVISVLKYALYVVVLLISVIGIWMLYANLLKNGFSDGYTESSSDSYSIKVEYRDYQTILDDVSNNHNSAGIQATIIFKNGEKWTGSSGYANHSKKIPCYQSKSIQHCKYYKALYSHTNYVFGRAE